MTRPTGEVKIHWRVSRLSQLKSVSTKIKTIFATNMRELESAESERANPMRVRGGLINRK